jgi:predicted Zn finger-like uncharacterized protein
MLIVCPSCASEYTIDPGKLGADGRTLRCAICRDTWFVTPDGQPGMPPGPEGLKAVAVADATSNDGPSPPARRRTAPIWAATGVAAAVLAALAIVAGSGRWPLALHWVQEHIGPAIAAIAAPGAPLEFRDVVAEVVPLQGAQEKAGAELLVSGEIANPADHEVTLPHLEILVRNGDEHVLASWTSAPPRPDLGPGEAVRFEARLASPPPDGRQVRVHFTTVDGIAVAARLPDT